MREKTVMEIIGRQGARREGTKYYVEARRRNQEARDIKQEDVKAQEEPRWKEMKKYQSGKRRMVMVRTIKSSTNADKEDANINKGVSGKRRIHQMGEKKEVYTWEKRASAEGGNDMIRRSPPYGLESLQAIGEKLERGLDIPGKRIAAQPKEEVRDHRVCCCESRLVTPSKWR
eukprot:c29957_g1_i1 orf=59-577(+)